MADMQFHLPDMSCGHCVAAITEAVKALDADAQLDFEREARKVSIRSEMLQPAAVAAALEEAGYTPA